MKHLTQLRLRLRALTVFSGLLQSSALGKLLVLLDALDGDADISERVEYYAAFVRELYPFGGNWTDYLLHAVLEEDDLYLQRLVEVGSAEPELADCLEQELRLLEEVGRLTDQELREAVGFDGYLPGWSISEHSFAGEYRTRLAELPQKGSGIYAKYHFFVLKNGSILPVKHPDATRLADLDGYESERQKVIDNTLALLAGKPAANILLYGDAGTGKSTAVKAVANEFKDQGLRLIELKKSDLHHIPELLDALGRNPLKFILFIDDLSFTRDDGDFSALKAVLEGSVAAKARNLVIYATSNRRHLVKESFSDREGDDIHRGDTVQEMISLSERFGLTITFSRPSKQQYLQIVSSLARKNGISIQEEELSAKADAYAIRRNGYSPRAAKQFVESLLASE